MTSADPAVGTWVRDFVARTLATTESLQLVTWLNDQIVADVPIIGADPDLRRALDASTHGQLSSFLTSLIADPPAPHPAPEAFEFARAVARRGLELHVLLGVYRFGQQAALRFITQSVEESDADLTLKPAALVYVWQRTSDYFHVSVEQLIGAYAEERERWLRSALSRRTQLIDAILRGEPVDVDASSETLGHSLWSWQTALVLWSDEPAPEPDTAGRLETLAGWLASEHGAARPLVMPAGAHALWAWVATDRPIAAGTSLPKASDGLSVAIGTPAPGLAGFRDSHHEALAAKRIADRGDSGPVVHYAAVEVLSLMSHDPAAMGRFITRELGPLAFDDPVTQRLRETVLASLRFGVNGAAERLHVHRNTVRYRVQQAEVLLGRTVDERRMELELALWCAES